MCGKCGLVAYSADHAGTWTCPQCGADMPPETGQSFRKLVTKQAGLLKKVGERNGEGIRFPKH